MTHEVALDVEPIAGADKYRGFDRTRFSATTAFDRGLTVGRATYRGVQATLHDDRILDGLAIAPLLGLKLKGRLARAAHSAAP